MILIKKTILVFGLRGFPNIQGGIETHCQQLFPRLVKYGYEITLLGRRPYTGKKPYDYNGVNVVPVFSPKKRSLEALIHTFLCCLITIVKRPSIVHIHAIGPSFFIPFLRLFGFKVIATHHGFDYHRAKWGRFARWFLKTGERNMCSANAVISISTHITEFLDLEYSKKAYQIPNGVVLPQILPSGEYCKKWKLKKGNYVLFCGRFVPEKNIHDLIEAFKGINTDWKLVIAGDADHEDEYSLRIKQERDTPNIVLTGFITGVELQELYSNAGCFVLPSSHEGLPIALLEALSYGLHCVASDIPANRGIGHHSIIYFPVHDIQELRGSIDEIIKTEKNVDHNSLREFINEHFNWDYIASETAKIYDSISKK